MREILFRGKTLAGRWVEGSYYKQYEFYGSKEDADVIITSKESLTYEQVLDFAIVIPETVGQYTGLTDKNGKKIFEGDIVEFLGSKYEVLFECGAFGIAGVSDWEAIEKQIPISTGCDNDLCACLNDNYISLWEIYWNLENSHEVLDTVKIIGNIHDNPELLEVK